MMNKIKQDLKHHICGTEYKNDVPIDIKSLLKAWFSPEFRVVLAYRLDSWLWTKGFKLLTFLSYQRHKRKYNCDISPACIIGGGLRIVHCSDIVIGPLATIGEDCVLYNGVTLGNRKGEHFDGMPELGNNVLVGTGAKLLGKIKLTDKTIVGANAVVISSSNGGTMVGIPAKEI